MKRLMMTILAAATLLTGSALNVSADSYRRYSERQIREIGFYNGYEIGYREGQRDLRLRISFDYKQNRAYKNGMVGYRDEYHHDGNYKKGFRNGFEEGYRDAYNRRGRSSSNRPGWEDDNYRNGGYRDGGYRDRDDGSYRRRY